jgi:hypothetical protein
MSPLPLVLFYGFLCRQFAGFGHDLSNLMKLPRRKASAPKATVNAWPAAERKN